jgi:hypothetical protein
MLTRGVEFAAHLWRTSPAKDQFWREFAEFMADGMSVGVPSSSSLAFQDGAPICIPVAKARIPAAPVACERICGSR